MRGTVQTLSPKYNAVQRFHNMNILQNDPFKSTISVPEVWGFNPY